MAVKRFDTINVIPFIDIMLVLLVIVLTTATFIAKGLISVELPQADAQVQQSEVTEHSITIDKDGTYYLNKEKVTLDTLKAKLKQFNVKDTIVLRGDKRSEFNYFVSIMSLLKKRGFEQLYIVTTQE